MPIGNTTTGALLVPIRAIRNVSGHAIAIACGVSLILAGLFIAYITLSSSSIFYYRTTSDAPQTQAAQKVYLATPAAASLSHEDQTLELHIANNGLVLLRGARVVSTSGNTMSVKIAWGSEEFSWIIRGNSDTRFLNSEGEHIKSSDIRVGDYVVVTGNLDTIASQPTVVAQYVRAAS